MLVPEARLIHADDLPLPGLLARRRSASSLGVGARARRPGTTITRRSRGSPILPHPGTILPWRAAVLTLVAPVAPIIALRAIGPGTVVLAELAGRAIGPGTVVLAELAGRAIGPGTVVLAELAGRAIRPTRSLPLVASALAVSAGWPRAAP